MKKCVALLAAAALMALLIRSGALYLIPLRDPPLDWSLSIAEDGAQWQGDKGWQVYVVRGGEQVPLVADGLGGYRGCAPGETFYFSRHLTEEADNPVLRLQAVNSAVAVFLDGAILYTDVPGAGERIGEMALPMLDYDRDYPVEAPLPQNYAGRTLTVAQAGPLVGDGPVDRVFPCDVSLSCDYGYESGLIAEASRSSALTTPLMALGAALCVAFAVQALRGRRDWGLLCCALFVLAQMGALATDASYSVQYIDVFAFDVPYQGISFMALMLFVGSRLKNGRLALLPAACALAYALALALREWGLNRFSDVLPLVALPSVIALASAALVTGLAILQARRGNRFCVLFGRAVAVCLTAGAVLAAAHLAATDAGRALWADMTAGHVNIAMRLFGAVNPLMLLATLAALAAQTIENALARSRDRGVIQMMDQAARQSYDALKRQNGELMARRHDENKHLALIGALAEKGDLQRIRAYVEELTGERGRIAPIVQCGSDLLDLILNSRLSQAREKGIRVEITRASAPAALPLADADAGSLFLNLLDNAMRAAADCGEAARIALDMHGKANHFVFALENSVRPESPKRASEQGHGLGLKISERIVRHANGIMKITETPGYYKVTVALPISGEPQSGATTTGTPQTCPSIAPSDICLPE